MVELLHCEKLVQMLVQINGEKLRRLAERRSEMLGDIEVVRDQLDRLKDLHAEMLVRLSNAQTEIEATEGKHRRNEARYIELLEDAAKQSKLLPDS